MRGSSSARLAFWCAVAALAAAPAWPDGSSPRTVVDAGAQWNGWETQDWPQGGQDQDRQKNVTAPFTNAAYNPCAQGVGGGGGPYLNPCDPTTMSKVPYPDSFSVFDDVNAEPVTVYVPALKSFGPHAVGILQKPDGFVILANVVTASTNIGNCHDSELDKYGCHGSYTGTPALLNWEITDAATAQALRSPNTTFGVMMVYAMSNGGCRGKSIYLNVVLVGAHHEQQSKYTDGVTWEAASAPVESTLDYAHGLTMDSAAVYFAGGRPGIDAYGQTGSGIIFSGDVSTLAERWRTALQVGSDSTGPLPRGQEPPPAAERYHPTTPVAVNGSLAVVGCVGYHDDWSAGYKRDVEFTYALMAFDTRDGHRRWYHNVDSAILPTPAIAGDTVVFGTKNGRAYGIQRSDTNSSQDGILKWQTEYSARIRYRTQPYNVTESFADTWLTGPAIDGSQANAYFGGSDGRVHRFTVGSGSVMSSDTLLLYSRVDDYGSGWVWNEHDANGAVVYRPCPIYTSPAVLKNKLVVVKCRTEGGTIHNGTFVFALNLPDLSFDKDVTSNTWNIGLNANQAKFHASGNTYGAFALNLGGLTMAYDPIRQVRFLQDPGIGYSLPYYTYNYQLPQGGISISNGFLMVSDLDSNRAVFVPSTESHCPPIPSGVMGPFNVPSPGPAEPFSPAPLGPVEVYPNPFDPGRAAGGTVKFRNLPTNSTIELYTLAYERVRALREANHRAEWNGSNEAGQQVAAGVYLYKVFVPGNVPPVTGRIALTRR